MPTTSTVPDSPADPEAAALEIIVRPPVELLRLEHPHLLTEVLQDYCGVLSAEGALSGLSWADAKQIAAAVPFDVCTREDVLTSAKVGRSRPPRSASDQATARTSISRISSSGGSAPTRRQSQ